MYASEKFIEIISAFYAKKYSLPMKKGNSEKGEGLTEGRIIFTPDNINHYLVSFTENPKNYSLPGLLTYLFKTWQDAPPELLAKIKVLTMKKKLEVNSEESVRKRVMIHLFAVLNMKGSFFDNLFTILKSEGFLPHLVASFFFKDVTPFDITEEHIKVIAEEIAKIYEPQGGISRKEFSEACNKALQIDSIDELKKLKTKEKAKDDIEVRTEKHNAEFETEEFSLESLHDDKAIEELDQKLAGIFKKEMVSEKSVEYTLLLLKSLENILKSNSIINVSVLWDVMYFFRFSQISQEAKHVMKRLVGRFGDKNTLFRIFSAAVIVDPVIYGLYSVFRSDCGDSFDIPMFFRNAIELDHSDIILRRIDAKEYYEYYLPNMGEKYKDFYLQLIFIEFDLDQLTKELQKFDETSDYAATIRDAISDLERRRKKRKMNKIKKDKKEKVQLKEKKNEESELKVNDENQSAEKAEASSKRVKKRTFADKIGKKLASKKRENKKRFRYAKDDEKGAPKKSIERKRSFLKKKYSKSKSVRTNK